MEFHYHDGSGTGLTVAARLGKPFCTALYGENASCHIAIGNALGPIRDPKEREALAPPYFLSKTADI